MYHPEEGTPIGVLYGQEINVFLFEPLCILWFLLLAALVTVHAFVHLKEDWYEEAMAKSLIRLIEDCNVSKKSNHSSSLGK